MMLMLVTTKRRKILGTRDYKIMLIMQKVTMFVGIGTIYLRSDP